MKLPDEMLMAYVDGELDREDAAAVERAMREDPAVAQAVARMRALRERVRQAYAPVLSEPLPTRLLAAAGAGAGGAQASPQSSGRRSVRRWHWPEWTALAATLALGLAAGAWLRPEAPQPLLELSGDGLVADGALAQALETRLSAEEPAASIRLGLSFRARDGRYCRTFVLDPPRALAGLACRDADGWRVAALGETAPARGELRLASTSLPPAVLAEVDTRLQGEALDGAGERAARATGWR